MSDSEKQLKLAIIVFGVGFAFLVLAACGAWLCSSSEQTNYEGWSWFYRFMNGDEEAAETLIQKIEEDMEKNMEDWEAQQIDYESEFGDPNAPSDFTDNDPWQYED